MLKACKAAQKLVLRLPSKVVLSSGTAESRWGVPAPVVVVDNAQVAAEL